MENFDWGNIIATISSVVLAWVMPYVVKFRKLLKEGSDVLISIDEALEDNKVTTEEITKIKKESREAWVAIQAFGKK